MRKNRVVLSAALVLAIGLWGAPSAFGAAPVVLSEAQLAAALLPGAKVPGGGWTTAAAGVIESRPWALANDIENGWCGGATDAYAAGELQVAATAEATLAKTVAPDEPIWFLWTKAYSFPDVARAKSFLVNVQAAALDCDGWVLDGEPVNGVSAETVAIPKIPLAVRTTISGDGVTATENYLYVRVANNVVVTHTRVVPTDDALALSIAQRSTKRLKKAVKAAA